MRFARLQIRRFAFSESLTTFCWVVLLVVLCSSYAFAITGDIDQSGRVDGNDLIIFSRAKGSLSGDSNFNPDADFNNDGAVNDADLVILTAKFGFAGRDFSLWVADSRSNRVVKLLHETGVGTAELGGLN